MTELCDGILHDLVKEDFDERDILRQIVEGLHCLHSKKFIHRDLKPHNILFTKNSADAGSDHRWLMKLADFGCSRIIPEDRSHLTRSTTNNGDYSPVFRPFGTDGWIAPKILNGEQTYTDKIDIFPLGLILAFTFCKGLHPYGADTREKNDRIKRKQPILYEVSGMLKERNDGSSSL